MDNPRSFLQRVGDKLDAITTYRMVKVGIVITLLLLLVWGCNIFNQGMCSFINELLGELGDATTPK